MQNEFPPNDAGRHEASLLLHTEKPRTELEAQVVLAEELYCSDASHNCDLEVIKKDTTLKNEIMMHWVESGFSSFFRKFIQHPRYMSPPFNGDFLNISLTNLTRYKENPELLDEEI